MYLGPICANTDQARYHDDISKNSDVRPLRRSKPSPILSALIIAGAMFKMTPPFRNLLTTFALVFAMVFSSLAHTGMARAMSPDLAAYVAAGGSLEDLCSSASGKNGTQTKKCEVCRLLGAALEPRPCLGAALVVTEKTRVLTFVAKRLHHRHPLDPTRLTRAPPQA